MNSRLDNLEVEIANGISRDEEMEFIRRNIAVYFTPEEFYEIYDKLAARQEARVKIAEADLP
jgi:hypothetical protein